MILSNTEIKRAMTEGRIILTPPPQNESFGTTAVDLRLGDTISIPKEGQCINIDPSQIPIANTLKTFYDDKLIQNDLYVLKPGKFILSKTQEYISLPIKKMK